jgi:GntR family transcriptional regulator
MEVYGPIVHVANQVTLPAYLQILHSMRARLASGDWRVGDQIPTDEELMAHFGVSRFTVRAALDVLVADGIVKRYRRRGSFVVARPEGAGTWMLTSLDDLVMSSFPTAPIVIDAAECRCDAQIAGALGLDETDDLHVLCIRVVRTADAKPYAHSIIHIPRSFARGLPPDWRDRIDTEPFIGMVAAGNGLAVHKAIQVAQAIGAPAAIAAVLQVAAGSPLLLLERTFLAREGVALEHARIFCRPDRYRQIIEFRSNAAPSQRKDPA